MLVALGVGDKVSRPPRARGLKLLNVVADTLRGDVAPPAGAWIETSIFRRYFFDRIVAPPAGAWIETTDNIVLFFFKVVAPPAGAWIETFLRFQPTKYRMSRPPRARGLKRL